jgi:aspartate/methionine/tyrosine aminotransferase
MRRRAASGRPHGRQDLGEDPLELADDGAGLRRDRGQQGVPDAGLEQAAELLGTLRCPAYAQHTLRRWLRDDGDFVDQRVACYQRLRDQTVAFLGGLPGVTVAPARGTAYLFPDVGALGRGDQEVALRLKEAGLLVNPGYQFGAAGAGHFRICFAQDEAAWTEALPRLAAALAP